MNEEERLKAKIQEFINMIQTRANLVVEDAARDDENPVVFQEEAAGEKDEDGDDDEEEESVKTLSDCFLKLSKDAQDFYLSREIPERFQKPKALDFYRDWVAYNRPVIFRGAAFDWPALSRWNKEDYLLSKLGDQKLSVSLTPDGYADSVKGERFLMPKEENMTFEAFLDKLRNPHPNKVYYIQKQNSNLTGEFKELFDDVRELPWASEAFGKEPDAVNFWMGEERAVTSSHKDPYENIYVVVKGYKDIILHPPSDLPWLPYKNCSPAIYEYDDTGENLIVKDLNDLNQVSWIDIDPLNPNLIKYPAYQNANPVQCRLHAGDVLYLPSLWFHHLKQSHGCIAVNFWYDMEYNSNYNYFNLLSNLLKIQ